MARRDMPPQRPHEEEYLPVPWEAKALRDVRDEEELIRLGLAKVIMADAPSTPKQQVLHLTATLGGCYHCHSSTNNRDA